jgi:putative MFS transporter
VPVIIGRFFIVQSPLWLMFRGRVKEAEAATERLLLRDPLYPKKSFFIAHKLATTTTSSSGVKRPGPRCFRG